MDQKLADFLSSGDQKSAVQSLTDRVAMPSNVGTAYDKSTGTGSFVESGIEAYKDHLSNEAWNKVKLVVNKYGQLKNNPKAVLRLFGGNLNLGLKVGEDIAKIAGLPFGTVPMPGYMSKEDQGVLRVAVDQIKRFATDQLTHNTRTRPNYPLLFTSVTNNGLLNTVINETVGQVFGLDTSRKKIFEQGRIGWKLPNHQTSEIQSGNGLYSGGAGATAKKCSLVHLKNRSGEKTSIFGKVRNIVTTIANGALDGLADHLTDSSANTDLYGAGGMEAGRVLHGGGNWNSFDEATRNKYDQWSDPYAGEHSLGAETLAEAMDSLTKLGSLSSYSDWAGFELGSDHQWKIELYPYQSVTEEGKPDENRCCVTPLLPSYYLPNFWTKTDEIQSTYDEYGVGGGALSNLGISSKHSRLVNRATADVFRNLAKRVDINENDLLTAANHGSLFSFSRNLPVLSYDLNIGTLKTDSLKLFNGSSSEIFAGFQFNTTMNMSILDDVYGSMNKYFLNYIRCAYNMYDNSLAPYYNCSFEIILTVYRSGGQIKYKYRLIGIPIEFTPRFSGQQDPNESRVDITFAIIGFIPFTHPSIGLDGPAGKMRGEPKDVKWSDINIFRL